MEFKRNIRKINTTFYLALPQDLVKFFNLEKTEKVIIIPTEDGFNVKIGDADGNSETTT